ncbi:MAG TPA: DUF2780 domain-containing protein [Thermomicrobiales bacterium]|nr:DUF2780 domain-containing protein [Thermomicrobiales bacterium]
MDELIEKLKSQAGLSPEQAKKAAGVVADFLETKMSGDQLQSLAANIPGLGQFSNKIPDDAGEKLGGMLRGFRDKKD